jgi:hypothetical protein
MKVTDFSEEEVAAIVEAFNKFGCTIEESARVVKIMSKKPPKQTNLTPKQYGMKLKK